MQNPRDRLALDFASARTVDQDGHMRVALSNVSKANVCPYRGSEIPDGQQLGLRPGQIYNLLRDPAELAKAAPSLAGKPILMDHQPVSAADHPHAITVGAVGGNVRFVAPYLQADLTFWDGEAIAAIKSGAQSELSCGYFYKPDMRSGTYQGTAYDGVMRNIRFNHLAIVSEGRAGPDVMVGDASELHSIMRDAPHLSREEAIMVADALRRVSMATDNDDTTTKKALVALVKYLQAAMGAPELDEILMMLDDGSAEVQAAGDRLRKRKVAQDKAAAVRNNEAAYRERFPNAGRLW